MVLHENDYQEALVIMNEILHTLDGKKRNTVLILSELLFLAIHATGDTPVEVFQAACAQMSKNYKENHANMLNVSE